MANDKDKEPVEGGDQEEESCIIKFLKILCCPIILIFMSVKIYICGCFKNICAGCFHSCQSCCCGACEKVFCGGCGGCCRSPYLDEDFPANSTSLGNVSVSGNIEWKPLDEVVVNMHYEDLKRAGKDVDKDSIKPCMVEGKIEPSDILQGQLGTCYFLSAIAAIAEHPGVLFKSLRTTAYNPYGKYTFRFFNANEDTNDWEDIVIDSLIPTKNGRTVFAGPHNQEMWPALMEKALAKFCGSFEKTEGGSTAWALTALMGSTSYVFNRDNTGKWKRWGSHWEGSAKNKRGSCLKRNARYGAPDPYPDNEMWNILVDNDERKSIMCCSVTGGNDTQKNKGGLALGHAYTLVRVAEAEGMKFCQVMNPWGEGTSSGDGEWNGRFSDADTASWNKYPSLKDKLMEGKAPRDDGIFWMLFEDFADNFSSVTICPRETGFNDLVIPVDEADCCPNAQGCCRGCCRFWVCCDGCKALCCAEKRRI